MNESIGGSGMFYIVIIIVSALLLLLMGFIAFSKAFKVKNHIINFIHEDGGEVNQLIIESDLSSVGYSSNKMIECDDEYDERNGKLTTYGKLIEKRDANNKNLSGCNSIEPNSQESVCDGVNIEISSNSYDYCVYKYTMADGSYYYTVLTYVHMNIPLVESVMHIPVTGETKIFNRKYD